MQAYSDPNRAFDPHALPDLQIWYAKATFFGWDGTDETGPVEAGWYYEYCSPGCLPDSDPFGPFETYDDALSDARQAYDPEEEN